MKIRSGFVSNSSSSSFCIYGTYIDFGEIIEKLKKTNLLTEDEENQLNDEDYGYDEIETILSKKTKLDINIDWEDESVYVGDSWSSVGDDETGRQFKDRIELELKRVFGEGTNFRTIDVVIEN